MIIQQRRDIIAGDTATRPPRLVYLMAEWNALTADEQEDLIRRVPPGKKLWLVSD